jgi:hypothetical protein
MQRRSSALRTRFRSERMPLSGLSRDSLVEAESNVALPLLFRYFGAWTCNTPALVEHELDERSADSAAIASEAIAWLDAQIDQFKYWSVEHFLQVLRQQPRTNAYLATVVTTMFMLGDSVPAEALCRDAIVREDAGGFSVGRESAPSQSFPELALAWLNRKRGSFH